MRATKAGKQGVAREKGRGTAVRAGRAQLPSQLEKATQAEGIGPEGDPGTVATRVKTIDRRNVATQTELPCERAADRVSGCGECLSLSLMTRAAGTPLV